MYCLKCRRVTETEGITTAASKKCRLIRRGQCSNTKTQFVKRAGGGRFLNTFVNKLPFKIHLPGHTVLVREQNSIED